LRVALAGDNPRGLRLAAGGGVPVEGAPGGGLVEPADELAVALADGRGVAAVGRVAEAAHQGLRRRPPAQVLRPLAGGLANALFLLLDVGHRRRNARVLRARGW
jgi:hypothetical protein